MFKSKPGYAFSVSVAALTAVFAISTIKPAYAHGR